MLALGVVWCGPVWKLSIGRISKCRPYGLVVLHVDHANDFACHVRHVSMFITANPHDPYQSTGQLVLLPQASIMVERALTVRRQVPASSKRIWALVADYPNLADLWDGLKGSRSIGDQTQGVGARRQVDLVPVGTMVETVTHWEDGRTIATKNEPSALVPFNHAESELTLEPDGDETAITFNYRYVPRGGPLGRVTGPVIDSMLRSSFEKMLAAIEKAALASD